MGIKKGHRSKNQKFLNKNILDRYKLRVDINSQSIISSSFSIDILHYSVPEEERDEWVIWWRIREENRNAEEEKLWELEHRSRADAKDKVRVMWLGNGSEVFFACVFVLSEINKTVIHCKEPYVHANTHTHTHTHILIGTCETVKCTAIIHLKSAQLY